MADVVTCFLRSGASVLLIRRSDAASTYPGRWAGVSGYVEGDADDPAAVLADARREIREETGLRDGDVSLVRAGDPFDVSAEAGDAWRVHPFLFDVDSRDLAPNEEVAESEWVHPTAIHDRETVPDLWRAYRAVAPTLDTVRSDTDHGSAYVSIRALDVLRDAASEASDWTELATLAAQLRGARPSMAALSTRVDRVMSRSLGDRTPRAVLDAACDVADDELAADDRAARAAADRLLADDALRVATLSRSGTVLTALRAVAASASLSVVVGESRPAREGVDAAERLVAEGVDVTLATDAALPTLLAGGADLAVDAPPVDCVLVGADAVLADGSVVNKVGTRSVALAARRVDVPVYAATASAKVRSDTRVHGERATPALYDGDAALPECNPLFERTPPDLVTAVVTELGALDTAGVRSVAADHREWERWADSVDRS